MDTLEQRQDAANERNKAQDHGVNVVRLCGRVVATAQALMYYSDRPTTYSNMRTDTIIIGLTYGTAREMPRHINSAEKALYALPDSDPAAADVLGREWSDSIQALADVGDVPRQLGIEKQLEVYLGYYSQLGRLSNLGYADFR